MAEHLPEIAIGNILANLGSGHPTTLIGGDDSDVSIQESVVPNLTWKDIAGQEEAIKCLKESIFLPLKFPHLFAGRRTPRSCVLLYGPPGVGKTRMLKVIASEAKCTFFSVNASDIVTGSEPVRFVKRLFEVAIKRKPSIVMIDNLEVLSSESTTGWLGVVTELLLQIDFSRSYHGVYVVGSTNAPWKLSASMKRRFERRIFTPLPDLLTRKRLFEQETENADLSTEEYQELAEKTEGYSCSDISAAVYDAKMQPIRDLFSATHFKHVEKLEEGDWVYLDNQWPKWTPCSPNDPDAVLHSYADSLPEDILEPPLSFSHYIQSISKIGPCNSEEDIRIYEEWRTMNQDY